MSLESSHTQMEYDDGGCLPAMLWQASYGQGEIRASWEAVRAYGLVPLKGYPVIAEPPLEDFGTELLGRSLPSTNVTLVHLEEYPEAVPEVTGLRVDTAEKPVASNFRPGRIDVVATFPVSREDKARQRLEFLKAAYSQDQRGALYSRLREPNGFAFVASHLFAQTVGNLARRMYVNYLLEFHDSNTGVHAEALSELTLSYGKIVAGGLHNLFCDEAH